MNITEIHRYLSGEATQAEAEKFEHWLELSEENRTAFKSIQEIYNVEIEHKYQWDTEAALKRFRQIINTVSATPASKVKIYHQTPRRKQGIWMKVAAIVIAVAGVSIYLLYDFGLVKTDAVNTVAGGITIETQRGEQKSFRLSDGSRIRLNSASRVYIPLGFAEIERSVELQGEAFFEVEQGHEFEFLVKTNSARILVLGTSFSVRAWQDRDESIVAVQTGKVSLLSSDPEIITETIVSAGQYSHVKAGKAPGPALDVNIDQFHAWTNKAFVFDQTPLKDVLRQLELHFNVRITVSDSSTINDPVTARYRSETLPEILRFTSITHGVKFEIETLNNNNQQ